MRFEASSAASAVRIPRMKLGTLSVALAAALLSQPLGSTPQATAAPGAATAFVDVVDGPRTSPDLLTITAGDSVIFVNRGIIPHNPTALDGSFKTAPLKSGDAATVTFSQAGTFDFMCTLHTSQSGTIVVLPAPAAPQPPAVADPAPVADPAVADPAPPPTDPAPAEATPMAVSPVDPGDMPATDQPAAG